MNSNSVKNFCTWTGYYANALARRLGRDVERITRPLKCNQDGFEKTLREELVERVKRVADAIFSAPFALAGLPISLFFLTAAALIPGERIEVIEDLPKMYVIPHRVTILSLNACLQEGPFAPLTGGVVPPFDPAGKMVSRVAALAEWISRPLLGGAPDIYVGQELHDLEAQEAFIKEMQKKGYRYFIRDLGPHPICMNSGLLAASKYPIENAKILPFPLEDRHGLAKGTLQAVLTFTLQGANRSLRIATTHLNYGDSEKDMDARGRQSKRHIAPLLAKKEPAIILGDFNFDTRVQKNKEKAGLTAYQNLVPNVPTETDDGKKHLRGKTPQTGQSIDAIFTNFTALNPRVAAPKKVELNGSLLTDHFAVSVTVDV